MAGVKLLSDSDVFKNAVAAINANVTSQTATNIKQSFATVLQNLPNEANGDTIPTNGPYLTGSGILKVSTGS